MASTPLLIIHKPGRTLTADIYPFGSDTAIVSGVTLTEETNRKGLYIGTVTDALAGLYEVHVKLGSVVKDVLDARFFDTTDGVLAVKSGTADTAIHVGYPDRKIYIDTVNGTSGDAPGYNGTIQRPVASWADAKTLAGLLGFNEFYVIGGSTLILSSSAADYNFDGENYAFYPNGENIGGTVVRNATVFMSVSSATTTATKLIACRINQLIVSVGIELRDCIFISGNEHDLSAYCKFYNCRSDTQAANPPIFDFQTAGLPVKTATFVNWVGDLRIKRLHNGASCHVYGRGIITIDADCTGGLIRLRGNFEVDDDVSGGFDNLANGSIDYVKQPVNVKELDDSEAAATFLSLLNRAGLAVQVDDSTDTPSTTTFETTNTDIADDDELNGLAGTFLSLSGLANNIGTYFITDSQGTTANANNKLKLTVEGLTQAPANGEYFLIMGARSRPS